MKILNYTTLDYSKMMISSSQAPQVELLQASLRELELPEASLRELEPAGLKVLLASKSEIKIKAVKEILGNDIQLDTITCDHLNLPPQPVDSAEFCALTRLDYIMLFSGYDIYIAIENGIYETSFVDVCVVAVNNKGEISTARSIEVPLDKKIYKKYLLSSNIIKYGRDLTYGKFLNSIDDQIPHDNWMKHTAGIDRNDQIISALKLIF